VNIGISIEATKCKYDFCEVTSDILYMFPFPGRVCFGCGKKFKLHDMVSMAMTDRGNKLFHTDCLRAAMKPN